MAAAAGETHPSYTQETHPGPPSEKEKIASLLLGWATDICPAGTQVWEMPRTGYPKGGQQLGTAYRVGWQWRTPEPTAALGTILTQAYEVTVTGRGGEARKGLPTPCSTQTAARRRRGQLTSPQSVASMLKARGTPSWEGSDFRILD